MSTIQTANFSTQPTQSMGQISKQTISLPGLTVIRVTVNPGASWSKDLKAAAGTESCQSTHVGYMLSGTLAVKMTAGQEEHFNEGAVFMVPPGHDAWCAGDEAAVFVEFSSGSDAFGK